jgi:hypothetical protein
MNDAYQPDTSRWVCTCPAFVVSRFLICKHLVQLVPRASTLFFKEVDRYRTAPFWRHPALATHTGNVAVSSILESSALSQGEGMSVSCLQELEHFDTDDDDTYEDEDDGLTHSHGLHGSSPAEFEAELLADVELLRNFAAGLEYQLKFRDRRLLDVLHREGRSFFRMAHNCLDVEKQENTNRGGKKATWQMGTAMFYRPRPRLSELNT